MVEVLALGSKVARTSLGLGWSGIDAKRGGRSRSSAFCLTRARRSSRRRGRASFPGRRRGTIKTTSCRLCLENKHKAPELRFDDHRVHAVVAVARRGFADALHVRVVSERLATRQGDERGFVAARHAGHLFGKG